MEIYIVIGIIIGTFALIETFSKFKYQNTNLVNYLLYLIITICAVVFVGFRECGFDYESYNALFDSFSSDEWILNAILYRVEFGFAFLNHILWDYRSVLVAMALFTIGLQFKFIYKYSPLPFVSLFILLAVIFYPMMMGQIRQALAMSIVLWAMVNRDRKFLFLSLIVLASFFHATAIIGLFVLFLPDKLFSTKTYFIALSIALVSNFTMKSVFISASNLLPAIMSEKVDIYSSSEDFVLGLNLAMLLRVFIFIVFIILKDKFVSFPKGSYFVNVYFLSLLIYLGIGSLPQIAVRGSLYFYCLEPILISMLIFNSNNKFKTIWLILFVGINIYRQFGFFSEWTEDYIPYQNTLFNFVGV